MRSIYILIILSIIVNIEAAFTTLEIDNQSDDVNVVVTTALFSKINWIIMEIEKINKNLIDFNERLDNHDNQGNSNLRLFKAEINEALLHQTIETDKMLMDVKQEVLKEIDLQENLVKTFAKDIVNSSQMWNKNLDMNQLPQNHEWSVILRRQDGSENFDRNWSEYKNGFGNPNGEFFIGLEKLHAMTTYGDPQELLIVLRDFDNQTRYAKYADFVVGNETEKYKIKKINNYSGDAKDSFSPHLDMKFSTKDEDNDTAAESSCAPFYKGGWWFSYCYHTQLTGPYLHQPKSSATSDKGIIWSDWHGIDYSLKFVEMMIRPKS